jgi:hypothetical protein
VRRKPSATPRRESVFRWKSEAAKTKYFIFFKGGKGRLGVFDRRTVQIHVDQSSTQDRQLPFPGYSVDSIRDFLK